ncbi:MAG: hypothetical protein M3321_02200 [Actinomycetota bacterium]|nr:hypothetical protein [Actinomycetota bacterium]
MPASSDTTQAARAGRNQALYREVNERVQQINEAFDSILPLGDWICECAKEQCTERLALTHEEYELLRADGTRFAVLPDDSHVFADVELVVERHERYWVVEKVGVAAEVAARIDPRDRTRLEDGR